jgi:myosin heavy subunit
MAVPSSLERSARLRFAFQNPSNFTEATRPGANLGTVNRLSSPILRSVASPVNRIANVQSPEPSMLEEIVSQCRRINPDFSASSGSLNLSVSQALKKAVDSIIDNQGKSRPGDVEKMRETISDLTFKLEEMSKKLQISVENERKASLKEEKFAIDEIKLLTEKKHLEKEKSQISALKKNYLQLESELKKVEEILENSRAENQEKEIRIQELLNENLQKDSEIEELRKKEMPELIKIQELQEELALQTENILQRSQEIEERENRAADVESRLKKEVYDLEAQKKEVLSQLKDLSDLKLKLNQESEFFEQSNKELASFKLTFEIEQNKLREQRQALELEKAEIAATHRALTSQKSELLEAVEDLEQQKLEFIRTLNNAEENPGSFPNLPESHPPVSRETLEFFPHLRSLISDTVNELARRTVFIEKWTNNLKDREVTFESRLDDVKLVLALLNEKVHTLEKGFHEFEPLISVVQDMLEEIDTKKLILEEDAKSLNQEIMESCGNDYLGSNANIFTELLNDFEIKANELLAVDEHLQDLQEKLLAQIEENSRVARFLMEDRLEFEKEKLENKRDIEEATSKLLQIQAKADMTLDQMSKKEKEVLALQQTIDCRSPFSDDFSASLN